MTPIQLVVLALLIIAALAVTIMFIRTWQKVTLR